MQIPKAQTDSVLIAQRLRERLADARRRTDAMFDCLSAPRPAAARQASRDSPDALYQRPIAERHRLVFYLGHLETFDWNLLAGYLPLRPSINPAFDRLFAFGIDPLGSDLPQDRAEDWPAVAEILAYRQDLRRAIDVGLEGAEFGSPGLWAADGRALGGATGAASAAPGGVSLASLLGIAIEHRLMHAETLCYLFNRLPLPFLQPPADALAAGRSAPRDKPAAGPGQQVRVPAGPVVLGRPRNDGAGFGWDNEYPEQRLELPAFCIDRHMVSNRQFLGFIAAGGYDDPQHWKPEDWDWRVAQGIHHPGFWRHDGQGWVLRTVWREQPLPLDGPVYVSHAEANAYAAWAGLTLPSEAQWMRAALGVPEDRRRIGADYLESLAPAGVQADFRAWEPRAVSDPEELAQLSEWGVAGLYGNGWEWTSTPFAAVEGFEAHPAYPGYSRDFFDGRHYVLKGGSVRTAGCMLRPSFRNWFQPHYQHVYAGLRCVGPDHQET